jgi:photosystem II stability/assembly factor-like uncharacterized protein
LYFTNTRAREAFSTDATGLTYSSGTGVLSLTSGYVIPTTSDVANWNSAVGNTVSSVTGPLTFNSGNLGMSQANATTDGYLTSTDWNTFNNKMGSSTVAGLSNNYALTWTGTNFANSTVYDNGTNVGIGTTTPDKKLTVAGDINITGDYYKNGVVVGNSSLWTANGNNINYTSGNIGIGTTTPNTALSVVGDISFSGNMYRNGVLTGTWATTSSDGWLSTKTTDSLTEGATNLYFTNSRARQSFSTDATGLTYSSTTGALSLVSGYDIPLTASTTAWNNALASIISSVSGPLSFSSNVLSINKASSTADGYLSSTDWTTLNNKLGSSTISSLENNYLSKWSGSSFATSTVYDNGTNVGIGTTTPDKKLTVAGDINLTGGLYRNGVEVATSGSSLWTPSASNIYYNSGNVGIGTTTPGSILSVAGDIAFTGNLYQNGNLVAAWSDANLNTWLATKSTTNLTEGTNLYFTNDRADSRISSSFGNLFASVLAGTTTDVLAEGVTNKYFTNARVGTYLDTYNKGYFFSTTSADNWYTGHSGSATQWTTSGSDIYYAPGTVGIGATTTAGQTLTVFGSTTATQKAGYFSTDNMLLSSLEGGSYFGRTAIRENNFALNNYGNTWTPTGPATTTWKAIAVSSNGKYQSAVVGTSGQIYISSDYGVTWTAKDSSRAWTAIAMTADGKIQSATVSTGNIYVSYDYGVTWTSKGSSLAWAGISMSSDGKIQTAVVSTGYAYVSTDYGATWTQKGSSLAWTGVAMSSDGKIQTATVSTGNIYISSDYGNTWTAKGSSLAWSAVAMSDDGKIQTGVVNGEYIYISSNYGSTWTQSGSSLAWNSVSMSADGKIQTATVGTSGQIYISSDYGVTWTAKDSARAWTGAAVSSDGKVQTAVVTGGQIYISHADTYLPGGNFGVGTSTPSAVFAVGGDSFLGGNITGTGVISLTGTGTSTFASALNVTANATSTFANGITISDGCFAVNNVCVAGTGGIVSSQWTTSGTNIYYNGGNVGIGGTTTTKQSLTVFGSTTATQKAGYFSTDNMLLASLEGGSYFGRTKITENNFSLNNYGNTWTAKDSVRNWRSSAMSADGKIETAVVEGGQIYTSTDYGNTWTAKGSSLSWSSVAMSSDGKIQTATVGYSADGQIYISSDYGVTWTAKESSRRWSSVAMSADGKIQTATGNTGNIYVSYDYGMTWAAKDSSRTWTSVAMSSDGKIQAATVLSGQIYISTDYGNTWTAKGSSYYWSDVAMSSDGKIQTATVGYVNAQYGYIYVSTDYGNTWTAKDSSRSWFSVAMSSDGKIQTAGVYNGLVYISTDYGNTWTAKGNTGYYSSIAMSSDGKIQATTDHGLSKLYISHADTYLPSGNFGVGTSSPSAMFAVAGDSFLGGNITGTGVVNLTGVGTSTFASLLNVTANATSTFSKGINLSGGCFAVNGVCLANGTSTQWTTSGSNIYYNTGNVGIGTTTPFAKLSVGGSAYIGGNLTATGTLTLSGTGTSTFASLLNVTSSGTSTFAGGINVTSGCLSVNGACAVTGSFVSSPWLTSGSNIYYANGNVGIGATTTAGQALTVFGSTSVTYPKAGYFSTDNMLLSSLEGGAYFGRTKIVESDFDLNNYGNTWTATGPATTTWRSIAMSSNGKYQSAVVGASGQIHISSDYGVTWTAKAPTLNWSAITMSSDGKIQTAVLSSGLIYISTDYGNTWTSKGSSRAWTSVAMSADGKIQTATVSNGQIYISTDYGNTWTAKDSSRAWTSVAMSSDGKIQTATVGVSGQIYVSSDYGATWVAKDYAQDWHSVAMSADGRIQTAVVSNGYIYISVDYGNTWTAKESGNWYSVAMSADGKIQVAVVNGGQIYLSTDYGTTWIAKDSSRSWYKVAMSSDGKVISAVVYSGQIYVSHADTYLPGGNFGIGTSSPSAMFAVGGDSFLGGNITSTGVLNILGTSTFASALSVTANATSTFAKGINLTGGCLSVNGACALTGSYVSSQWISSGNDIYYASGNVGIGGVGTSSQALTVFGSTTATKKAGYFSTDNMLLSSLEGGAYFGRTAIREKYFDLTNYGNTWAAKDSARNWWAVAMSSDGKIQTAVVYGGYIYVSTDYGNTWTTQDSSRTWISIAMSSDGKIQTAGTSGGYIFTSSDYGDTWAIKQPDSSSGCFPSVAMSSDGKMQTALDNGCGTVGQIYISNDYGSTWTVKDSSRSWTGVAVSSDGKIQTAVVSSGQIYISIDYGNTWTVKDSTRIWSSVAMSADGKYQTAVVDSGQIYISTNYGSTWTAKDSARGWTSVAMSADGKIQTAVVYGGQVYISLNYGLTWTAKDSSRSWKSVAMSSDGKIQTGVVYSNGQIYVSHADTYLAGGNLGIGTSIVTYPITLVSGAHVTTGGTWTNASSRDLKENFTEVNGDEILAKINQLNITQWNYKLEASSTVHIGPIAEEFYDLFKTGGTDKSISSIDPAGVALIGIQTLSKKVEVLQKQLDDYKFGTSSAISSAGFLSYLETLGAKISNGLAIFKEIAADKITATVAMFDTVRVEEGIESKDKTTGEYSCMIIENGEWKKVSGRCADYNKPTVTVVENNSTPITNISTTTENILTETSTTTQNISTTTNTTATTTTEAVTSENTNATSTETTTGSGEVTPPTEPAPVVENLVVTPSESVVETPVVAAPEAPAPTAPEMSAVAPTVAPAPSTPEASAESTAEAPVSN